MSETEEGAPPTLMNEVSAVAEISSAGSLVSAAVEEGEASRPGAGGYEVSTRLREG